MWFRSLGNQPAAWCQVLYIALLPSCKRQVFVLSRKDIYSEYRFTFPAHNTSTKSILTTCRPTECLTYHHDIPCSIIPAQGIFFRTKLVQWWSHAIRIHQFCHILHNSEAADLRRVDWPFVRLSYNTGWMVLSCRAGAKFSRRLISSKSPCNIWYSPSWLWFMDPRIQGR